MNTTIFKPKLLLEWLCFFLSISAALTASATNTAPDCSTAFANPNSLWPPNHKMQSISIDGITDADGDVPTVNVQCIYQDEPLDSNGDGNTEPDADGINTDTSQVRRERQGGGNGRVYHIFFKATDPIGAACFGEVTVSVNHNKNNPAVDDGALYESIPSGLPCTASLNTAPVAENVSDTTVEDTPLNIVLNGSDADNDSLTYALVSLPQNGSVSLTNDTVTYMPAANFNGSDSFTYKANDGELDSNIATVTINVTPVNDAPTADAQSVYTPEDTVLTITLSGSDIDSSTLTFLLQSSPQNGTLSGNLPNISYTPNANFNGSDSFTFMVNDGELDSEVAIVDIFVDTINDAPIANPQSLLTDEDTVLAITLSGSDLESSSLTFQIQTQPSNGVLTGAGANLVYTPNQNFNGDDSFTFIVNDGELDSKIATVDIDIIPVNDKPVANGQPSLSTDEDTALNITLTGSDIENDTLSFQLQTPPQHGALSGTLPNVVYTPNANFNGIDSFVFIVNDGELDSDETTIDITVNSVNDAPTANTQNISTNEDTGLNIVLTGSDNEGSALIFQIQTPPSFGTLAGTEESLVYTPNENFNGNDSFTFIVNDGELNSNIATVDIQVIPVNDIPIANADSDTTTEDTALPIILSGSDIENNPLTYQIQIQPASGVLTGTGENIVYTPNENYHGPDSFTFIVNDGELDSAPATFDISITSVNDKPTASAQPLSVLEDTPGLVAINANDPEGDALTLQIQTPPSFGVLAGDYPNITYIPSENYNGIDEFVFVVNDGELDSDLATANITVIPVNDAPSANVDSDTTAEDTALPITLMGSDIENDPLTFQIQTQPANGVLTGMAENIVYTPNQNFNGSDSFTFIVNDGALNSGVATFDITVTPVNDAPTANNQTLATDEDVVISVLLSGSDIDNDPLSFAIVNQPSHGVLSGNAPNLVYTPNSNYFGLDSFTFNANDGLLDSTTATVTINMAEVNDAPEITSLPLTEATATLPYVYDVDAGDAEGDTLTFSLLIAPLGMTIDAISGVILWTPAENQQGLNSVSIQVADAQGGIDTQNFDIQVAPTPNQPPVIITEPELTAIESNPYTYNMGAIDPDIDVLNYELLNGPATMTIDAATGAVVWFPFFSNLGDHFVSLRVNDGRGGEDTQSYIVSIAVQENLPPAITSDAVVQAQEQQLYVYDVEAHDPNEFDILSYELDISPKGMSIVRDNGEINWMPTIEYIEGAQALHTQCIIPVPDLSASPPVVKWSWVSSGTHPVFTDVFSAPIVMQTNDDNQDGNIDLNDIPDVIINTRANGGILRILSGNDGTELVTGPSDFELRFDDSGNLTAADIDADGFIEIIGPKKGGGLVALNHDGSLLWTNTDSVFMFSGNAPIGGASIADIDGDGSPEIIFANAVVNADGTMRWVGSGSFIGGGAYHSTEGYRFFGADMLSYAADIDSEHPGQEIIVGASVYTADGTLLWQNDTVGDGYTAVGDLNQDGEPEIVVVASGKVYLLDKLGNIIWGPTILTGGRGGPPTIGDMDGDGIAEIGVANLLFYQVLKADNGGFLWASPIQELTSGITGSTLFDFNDDGSVEIVYADETHLRIYEGATGRVLYEIPNSSGTTLEYPVVADVDNDGHAEIVLVASRTSAPNPNTGVRVIEAADDNWVATRSLWNQHAYHIDNINDDGTVPAIAVKSWETHNTFRLNAFPDRASTQLADLSLSGLSAVHSGNGYTVQVTVTNRGLQTSGSGINVDLYTQDPNNGPTYLGSMPLSSLVSGESVSIQLDSVPSQNITGDLVAQVDATDIVSECVEDNNTLSSAHVQVRVEDPAQLSDTQSFFISVANSNHAPVIISTPDLTASEAEEYAYQVIVEDPDLGDAVLYSLADAPPGMAINTITGMVSWTPNGDQLGVSFVSVVVTDLTGASDEQSFNINVHRQNQPPQITTLPIESVDENAQYQYDADATDPNLNDELTFSLDTAPAGMSINTISGQIDWSPLPEFIQSNKRNLQTCVNESNADLADLTAYNPVYNNTLKMLSVNVVNRGRQVANNFNATLYNGDPSNAGNSLGSVSIDNLSIGGTAVLILNDLSADSLTEDVFVVVDEEGSVEECMADNNTVSAALVKLRVEDELGISDTQAYLLSVNDINESPVIDSDPVITAEVSVLYRYQVTVNDPDIGDDAHFGFAVAPAGATIESSSGLIQWIPGVDDIGNHTVTVSASDLAGTSNLQTYTLTVEAFAGNDPPQISSTPINDASTGNLYQYQVIASDPDGDSLTYNLTEFPAGMVMNATGLISWTPTIEQVGTHNITLQVDDGRGGVVTQQYSITVVEIQLNQPSQITSTPPLQAVVGVLYEYDIIVTDPDGDTLSYSLNTAPTGMSIDAVTGLVQWTPAVEQVGLHTVVVRVDDGTAFVDQTFSVDVSLVPAPLDVFILAEPRIVDLGESTVISVFTFGGSGEITTTAILNGAPLTLDNNNQATVTAGNIGRFEIAANASDAITSVNFESYFTVRDPNDTIPPLVDITGPETNSIANAPIDITGTVQDDNLAEYIIAIAPSNTDDFRTIVRGTQNVIDATLGAFDPTLLMNGQYTVLVQATDLNGLSTSESITLRVDGEMKVGNFSFTVEDLNIPVSGIPIRVTRTYDSRRRHEDLDFGYGWSINYQDVRIDESRQLGRGWQVNRIRSGPFNALSTFCTEPVGAPIVTVALPTGRIESFEVRAKDACHLFQVELNVELEFVPLDGSLSTLELSSPLLLRLVGDNLIDVDTGIIRDPDLYTLTTREGFVYNLDQNFGIRTVTDPNGNVLTYTNDGILHSDGKSILFNRNEQGRITEIIDPMGEVYPYSYDAAANLVSAADSLGNTTRYTYNRSHGLLEIIDPLGRPILKNIYDDEGRLIGQKDLDGNFTAFNHNLTGRESIVTDRLGRTTILEYDDMGQVLRQIDANNGETTFSYDEDGNQLTQTDPLGHTQQATYDNERNQLTQTDALGNTVRFEYNARGQEVRVEDARGNAFLNKYDSFGNILSVTDPKGNRAANNIDAKGRVELTEDVLGNITEMTYDASGNKLTEKDPLENITTYTYDDNGNTLSEARDRTLANGTISTETTAFEYDSRNRLVKTTDALGNVTETVFDSIGNEIQNIDALGRITQFEYDAYNRLTKTIYPDDSEETSTYDAEGNRLTETDRLGRTTTFEYDALNRLIRTTSPDGSSRQTEYDAADRVIAEIDENNNRTEHVYDDANRRTLTRDALGNETRFAYDADGNLIRQTDANNHITEFTYNSLDQKTVTTFANGSTIQEKYDALERLIEKTDQAGIKTKYEYDVLGRLTKVTNAASTTDAVETSYTYDEAGNKLTQTDAEGHTTSWEYDALGRVTARTLPLGQREAMTYNAVGNLITRTDFNGNTTTYSYDNNNSLIRTVYADNSEETYTYDAVGNRITATDINGTHAWAYDNRNRLISENKPDNNVIEYTYDAVGNRTEVNSTLQTSTGAQTIIETHSYDALNRLASTTDNNNNTTSYTYDAVGNRQTLSYANGNVTTYTYDELNRLTNLTTTDGATTVISSYDYTLHPTGRRTRIEENDGRISDYQYDNLYRLTQETIIDNINGNYAAAYTYDMVGNRIFSVVDGVSTAYTYDNNDRLLQQGGERYQYDDNGNTIEKTIDSDIMTYSYDLRDRLIETDATISGINTITQYAYDIDSNRTEKVESSQTTRYVVDVNRDYAQVLTEITNGQIDVIYLYGDDLISQQRNNQLSYYIYDGLGSTRALSNASGSLTNTYNYDAFGIELNRTGTTVNGYLFTGEQFDQSLNQYYLRARYYNQAVGRFTQMDTFMGWENDPITLHKYLYANADPVNGVDPSGNFGIFGLAPPGIQTQMQTVQLAPASAFLNSIGGLVAMSAMFSLDHEPTIKDVQIGKFQVKRCAVSSDPNCKANIPVIILGSDNIQQTQHVFDTQMNGIAGPILSRKSPPFNDRSFNRRQPECKGKTRKGFIDCDEYPYASTFEGGRANYSLGRVSLRPINSNDNQDAGRKLLSFYNACKVVGNDTIKKWFGVIAVPSQPATKPKCPIR